MPAATISGAESLAGTWNKEANYSGFSGSGIPTGGAVLPFGLVSIHGTRNFDAEMEFGSGNSFTLSYSFADFPHPDLSYRGSYSACVGSSGVITNSASSYRANATLRLEIASTPAEVPYLGVYRDRVLVIPFALESGSDLNSRKHLLRQLQQRRAAEV